jgi:hypothetical protein|tara:strand:+ start:65 stop:424 length:360 start_codon:yes stop_codon:yes gene_type:complete
MKYKKGDVVEVSRIYGRNRFIIAECRTNHYSAFNCAGNGKRLYKIKDVNIVKKVGAEPTHPWLLAMGFKIQVRQNGTRHDPDKWVSFYGDFKSSGDSAAEAVGNFIITHGEKLGITIEK